MADNKPSSATTWLNEFDIDQSWHDQRVAEAKRPVAKARGLAFLSAWYTRTRPQVDRYLAGIADILHRQSRGEAGGRSHPRSTSEVDKAALATLTKETVQRLTDEELTRLHRTCHTMAKET